jgi:hypothetical protein
MQDADDFCETWSVSKENADGSYGEPYTVCLPAGGNQGRPTCSCKGYVYNGSCRHTGSLRALLSQCGA